jgi:predicted dehydrogenase
MDGIFMIFGKLTGFQPLLHKGMPPRDIVDDEGKIVVAGYDGTAPDHIALNGLLPGGVLITLQFRHGSTIDQGLRWYIYGTKGEIEITSERPYISFTPETVKVRVHNWATDEITDVPISRPQHYPSELEGAALDLYGLYEAFRNSKGGEVASFQDAVEMHAFLDEVSMRGHKNLG